MKPNGVIMDIEKLKAQFENTTNLMARIALSAEIARLEALVDKSVEYKAAQDHILAVLRKDEKVVPKKEAPVSLAHVEDDDITPKADEAVCAPCEIVKEKRRKKRGE